MADLNSVSAQELGRRLRLARENANLRQDQAADVIGVSRPTYISIEAGSRRIKIQELQALANRYGISVNALLRQEALHTDLVPRFRRLKETEHKHVLQAVALLNQLVRAEVELENTLGIRRVPNYPPERGINSGDVVGLAEQHAQAVRDTLGLGSSPVSDIFTLIELDLGIRLFQRRLSSKVAGLFVYEAGVGACMMLNANHPVERRTYSAAHELGHFIGTRSSPEVLESDQQQFLSRPERYANAFGRAFLLPRNSLEESFHNLTAGMSKLTRRHVILLAYQYGVSREFCVRRLEEVGLVRKGVWDFFLDNGGISDAQAKEVLGESAVRSDSAKEDADRPLSHRLSLMAHAAWRQELMSEGQLAELLAMSRIELRKILDQIELEESETHDLLKLPRG